MGVTDSLVDAHARERDAGYCVCVVKITFYLMSIPFWFLCMCVSFFFLEECASHNRRPCQRHPRGSDNCRIEQVRFLGRRFLPCSIFCG